MIKFNSKKVITTRITKNRAGGCAFTLSNRQELVHAVLTTMLKDKFYESGDARLKRIIELVARVEADFVLNLAVYARKVMHLRSVSHALIGEVVKLSRTRDLGIDNNLISQAIYAVAERPDDLTEIAAYVGRPFTNQLKKGIRRALLKFDRYQLAKYQSSDKQISLVDLFNLVHPKPQFARNKDTVNAWRDLVSGELSNEKTWEARLSEVGGDVEGKEAVWTDLLEHKQLGYMALLKNLNNIAAGSDYNIALAISRLLDVPSIEKSKVLPFRFYTAYKNINNKQIKHALETALRVSVGNTPRLDGNVLVALDVSGSMSACMDKAAIIAAALVKRNRCCDFVAYDTTKKTLHVGDNIMRFVEQADAIEGGGTATTIVFDTDIVYDNIVIVSDNMSWNGGPVQSAYKAYKERTGANPNVFAIDIEGYGTIEMIDKKVHHICGFSEQIFELMFHAQHGSSLVEIIRDYNFSSQFGYKSN